MNQRKRGVIGWFFLSAFAAFNVWAAYSAWESWRSQATGQNTIGIERVLEIWAWGAGILGIAALLTRGKKSPERRGARRDPNAPRQRQ